MKEPTEPERPLEPPEPKPIALEYLNGAPWSKINEQQ